MPRTATLPLAAVSECCPQGLSQPLDRDAATGLAAMFKALADPARVQLVALIASAQSGERCACDLTEPIGLSQPTVSHHLRILTEAGLLTREQRGTWAWFALVPDRFAELAAVLGDLVPQRPEGAATGSGDG